MLHGRCTGQCCAVFTLAAGAMEGLARGEFGAPPPDLPFLLAMLVPLSSAEAAAKLDRLQMLWSGNGAGEGEAWRGMEDAPTDRAILVAFEIPGQKETAIVCRWAVDAWRSHQGWIPADWRPYLWCEPAQRAQGFRDPFACRHWDEASGLCNAYTERPWLCRVYPDADSICMHCGFQYPLTDRDPGDETGAEHIPRWATTW